MVSKRPKEFLTPTPQQILDAIAIWRSMHGHPNGQISRLDMIERQFMTAYGGSFGTVAVNHLPQAIDVLCSVIATLETRHERSPTKRLELLMEHLITTIGKGSRRAGLSDAAALTSALQLARLEPDFPYQ